jgi:hypothetical protein
VAGQQELQILEMLIGVWQGMARRAHDRAEQADMKPEGPSADYWRGFASALELAVEQLSTSKANLHNYDVLESEPQTDDSSQTKLREDTDGLDVLPTGTETWLQAIPLEGRAQRLLGAIRSYTGQWLKRTDIAHLLGNKMLSSGDMVLLQSLTEQGYIEARQVGTTAPSGSRWEYRAR